MLIEASWENCMSCASVFDWHKRFSEERENMKDNERPE